VLFNWDPNSTYILEPPFFEQRSAAFGARPHVEGARVLGIFADGLTTDHVSPGGEIPSDSPAGIFLKGNGIVPADFNTYVGRRGNHEVMARGTYANLRIRNALVDREGWWTRLFPENEIVSFHDAATRYADRGVPLIVLAGAEFGAGSSRDWAAKGPALLGVGAVIAISFERIHRSNLIGVGILPLVFRKGETVASLGLRGDELFSLENVAECLEAHTPMRVIARIPNGEKLQFAVDLEVRSPAEIELLKQGGMFAAALEQALADQPT
jgi:aconitate hydratase